MKSLEEQAAKIGNDPKLLLKRLNKAKAVLYTEARTKFNGATFDFESKSLISNCGRYALSWELRRWPDRSIDYMNQQTNTGNVYLKGLTK